MYWVPVHQLIGPKEPGKESYDVVKSPCLCIELQYKPLCLWSLSPVIELQTHRTSHFSASVQTVLTWTTCDLD